MVLQMRAVTLCWLRRRCFSTCTVYLCNNKEALASSVSKLQIKELAKLDVPIEKVSLSRGLAMNKFEKDFMIFPEYADTDDVKAIQGFTEVLRKSLELSVDHGELETHGSLTDSVKAALQDSAVFSALIPSSYDGLGLGHKDQMKVFEDLNIDWNVYANVASMKSFVNTLLLFGSEQLKEKYFPLVASGKCRPIIAFVDDPSPSSSAEVIGEGRTNCVLRIANTKCIGMHNANVALVFARAKDGNDSCYIIDHSELKEADKWEFKRDETVGLKAFDVGSLDLLASISDDQLVGKMGQGSEIRDELVCSQRLPLAAATVGYGKRLLHDLASLCNKTPSSKKDNALVSDESIIQYTTTDFALKLYILESASYYLAGLLDERLPVVLDIENALIHRLTRDVLHSSMTTCVDLAGLRSVNPALEFEKNIRDVATLLSMSREEASVESVAIATLSSWSSIGHKRVVSSLKRLFGQEKLEDEMRNPKLTHYIAEHAHPSLQMACQDLEFSMSRVNNVISKLMSELGKNLEKDYATLDRLVSVLQNHLAMVAVISRASRSYSIGLRNSDVELAWATFICSRLSRENWFLLEELNDYFGLLRLNPSLLNVGRAVFDMGGYQIESPLERNW
ncbi:hypothetical protein Y032_0138g2059 [Ancylostoma ceylanicum]|uniref:Uncharacterized protein n=1 Tax=Ancylostoma ceylanicum TaxID=53326 RepID=A0A016T4M0_9BILA|nr:hypothetical protein Y032_0138g2059 [Ancylostoma ceylanicum]